MTFHKTYDAFAASEHRTTPREAADAIGMIAEDFGDAICVRLFDGLYIEEYADGTFGTTIEREHRVGTKAEIAKWLFFEWYVYECAPRDQWTMADAISLYEEWCEWKGAPVQIPPKGQLERYMALLSRAREENRHADSIQYRECIEWLEWLLALPCWPSSDLLFDKKPPVEARRMNDVGLTLENAISVFRVPNGGWIVWQEAENRKTKTLAAFSTSEEMLKALGDAIELVEVLEAE